ncbi:MAG: lyase family protein [bacterium]
MSERIEKDDLGEVKIPLNAYYGIATFRSKEHFSITKIKVHKQMIRSLAIVKKACALANHDAGYLSKEEAKVICNACDEVINGRFTNQFLTDAIQGGAGLAMNMNMNEVIANRANEMLGGKLGVYDKIHPLKHVNLFQSANDVIPTSAKYAIFQLAKPLKVELKKLSKCFNDKSNKYANVFKMGRTHLQDSLPLSFGDLFKAISATVQRDIARIDSALEELLIVNLGTGAVGVTGYAHDDYIKHIHKRLNEVTSDVNLKKPDNVLDIARNLDAFVNLSHALKLSAINLSKTASDIRLMSSSTFNEISFPSVEVCHGLLEGKSNPVIAEVVNQVCFQVIGKDATITHAAEHGQLELNVYGPLIYPNLFDSLEYMTRALKLLREFVVEPMVVNESRCEEDILNYSGIAVTLLPKVGLDKTIAVLKEARLKKRSVEEIVLREGMLTEKEVKETLKIQNIKKL